MESKISLLIAAGVGAVLTGVAISINPAVGAAAFGCMIGAVLGSVYPDADLETSIMCDAVESDGQHYDDPFVYVGGCGHGMFTHTLLAVVLSSVPAWILGLVLMNKSAAFGYFFMCIGASMIVGGIIHLIVGTLFDPAGIMWAWPFVKKRISFTKSSSQSAIKAGTVVAVIILIVGGVAGAILMMNAIKTLGITTFLDAMRYLGI